MFVIVDMFDRQLRDAVVNVITTSLAQIVHESVHAYLPSLTSMHAHYWTLILICMLEMNSPWLPAA
jgi:hypothetical protein